MKTPERKKTTDAVSGTGDAVGDSTQVGAMFESLQMEALPDYDSSASHAHTISGAGPESTSYFALSARRDTANLLGNLHGGAVAAAAEQACVLSRRQSLQRWHALRGSGSSDSSRGVESGAAARQQVASLTSVTDGGWDALAQSSFVKSLDVQYMSPMKGELVVAVADDLCVQPLRGAGPLLLLQTEEQDGGKQSELHVLEQRLASSRCFGNVLSKKTGQICAQFVCHWE